MIVWLGGTFGVGKSTTARSAAHADDRLRLFDPEWVGYLLRHHLPDHEVADFQQLPSWSRLVPVVADELVRATGQSLLVVQSVLVESRWDELTTGLRELGHDVALVVLEADPAVVRARIEADEDEVGARAWRLRHLDDWVEARGWLTVRADVVLDTTDLSAARAAAEVGAHVDRWLGSRS